MSAGQTKGTTSGAQQAAQAATFEVPDPLLTDFYKASLAHVLITGDRDPPGFDVMMGAVLDAPAPPPACST